MIESAPIHEPSMAPASGLLATPKQADQLYAELRQAAIDWLASVHFEDDDHPQLRDSMERLDRVGTEIKALRNEAPGAMRVKAANSFFWFTDSDEIELDKVSKYADVSSRADLTLAAAMLFCPDFVQEIEPLRRGV